MDELVTIGGQAVKALPDGKLLGVGIRFDNVDLTGEYFDKDTYLGESRDLATMYQHGYDDKLGRRVIGKSHVEKVDDSGVWFETQLSLRDEYEAMIYQLAKDGKLSYSTGSSPHTVMYEKTDKGQRISQWLLTEISLTPTPAEPLNTVIPLKSLIALSVQSEASIAEASGQDALEKPEEKIQKEIKSMEAQTEEKVVAPAPTAEEVQKIANAAAEAAVKAYRASEPAEEDKTYIRVTSDPADRPFKSIAEQAQAVKAYELSMGQITHDRIKYLKATGASEGVPSDGGILLDPTLVNEFIKPIHEEGVFSSKVRRLPVGSNSNYGWINGIDETSRATGSRWGGVRGYRLAEAATKTASKPTFRRIQWELKKDAVVVYGTDELLADASQFSAIVNQACREELSFMVNDDIMNGLGLAGPQGFMNSGALITVTRTDANLVLHADIVNMWNRLDPRGRAKAEWYINNDVQPQLDKLYFSTGSNGVLSPFIGYRPDGVMTLYGRPVNVTEFNATLGTAGDIVLADMSQYLFWEKGGVEAATSIHVQFLTDETAFRFVYRCDGQSSLASPLTPYKGSTTTSPFVNLLATS